MKRLIPGLAFAGFFAAVIGTSFAAPATTPVADRYSDRAQTNAGVISPEGYVIHLECGDFVIHVEWSGFDGGTPASAIASDTLFDK